MIRVLFFAQLREQVGCSELILDSKDLHTLADVKRALLQQHASWSSLFDNPNLRAAVNQTYAKVDTLISDGDEVAFFPPVTGG